MKLVNAVIKDTFMKKQVCDCRSLAITSWYQPMQGNLDSGIQENVPCEIRNLGNVCLWNLKSWVLEF